MFNLNNKKVLITGATGRIGKAIASLMYKRGANVILSGTNVQKLEYLRAELLGTTINGNELSILPADLTNDESIANLTKSVIEKFDSIDILVNNAGITKDNIFMRMTDADWESVMQVNLNAPFQLIKAFIKGMVKNRYGRIINISSIVGCTGNPGQVNYASTKAGIIGMTKSLALEYATRRITANCIAPGFITSAMTDKLSDTQKNALLQNIPMQQMGTPEDIANTALFLASEEASYITGQTLHVNGGMAMY